MSQIYVIQGYSDWVLLNCAKISESWLTLALQVHCSALNSEMSTADDDESEQRRQVLTFLCIKSMQQVQYFCTRILENKEKYFHYSFNVPLYTHFTSSIRRYADIIVHRLLSAAFDGTEPPASHPVIIEKQCKLWDNRKTLAKCVSEEHWAVPWNSAQELWPFRGKGDCSGRFSTRRLMS